MIQRFKRAEKVGIWSQVNGAGMICRLAVRNVDVFFVPWLLDALSLYAYCLARFLSMAVPIALAVLGWKVRPQLKAVFQAGTQAPFQAAAARVNLGYLMVCGAVMLLVLSVAPYLIIVVGAVGPAFDSILIWAVIGQSAPVLFGATGILMHVVNRGAFHDLLLGLTTILFVVSTLALWGNEAALVAQVFAVSQLTHAAICALLLTQCGVWPGLTALFHKQIKLF